MGWWSVLNPANDAKAIAHEGEKAVESGAKDFEGALKNAAKTVKDMSPSELGHMALNVAGMIPVIGAPADAINAGWYAAQGDWKDAALSAATAIPGVGDLVGGTRLGVTALKIAEDGAKAERIVEDGAQAETILKDGAQAARSANDGAEFTKAAEDGTNAAKDGERAMHAGKPPEDAVEGPYSHLKDSPSVAPGKPYTAAQKAKIYAANKEVNGGVLRSDMNGEELVMPSKSKRGVTPPGNEAQIDHNLPRKPQNPDQTPGPNSFGNARVLSREQNRDKSNK